ncbi:NUDIX hydrolase [Gracilibacillus alcaliphilus]|uniref:NUDIX hydrolase n=1 Tax=Gracilibacillus alcaliphilus TaxID=1401441 RepID=UPI001959ABFE|nr:NUDIX hydrolase [Gracilibacillus alcaliphilus]MBM7676485.1 ADP-ribose pyrophosphatase YjhB (NUDIX family) [Gracilibacillus alcaliphilus]
MEPTWLTWAKELQSIAQSGLAYSKDVYDIERLERIREISTEILAHYTELDHKTIKELFANETGYATPKVDIRAVVFQEGKLLLVQEKADGKWALPGGWGDIGLTPSEVAVKEVKEEAGLDVKAARLLAVLDKKCHPHPPSAYHTYKILIQCEIVSGQAAQGLETSAVDFFAEDQLPPLSAGRNTESQIQLVFDYANDPEKAVYFD